MKRIGVMTSGGDAPGMNAALRAVVRTSIYRGVEPFGIRRGYQGMIEDEFEPMNARSVSNIIQRGGTILHTARSEPFLADEGRRKAVANLETHGIDGLALIGGDGTFRGAIALGRIWPGHIIGIPGTIDNDIYGTDYTIGFDTAVNTALDGIDKIRDTAASHERTFLIEVMGRHAGFIALDVGIAGGAEGILIPETPTDVPALLADLEIDASHGKTSMIIVVAEGDEAGGAEVLADRLKQARPDMRLRVCILGHLQRGGSPSARDRILATKFGAFAVDALLDGETGKMAGERNGRRVLVPFEEAVSKKKPVDHYLCELARILAQ